MMYLEGNYFVTGTGTGVGKTFVSSKILSASAALGKKVIGLKPIASGAENGVNEDAVALLEASSLNLELKDINPFCFEPAIAPHIAAKQAHVELTADKIVNAIAPVLNQQTDLCLVEGAGGWAVPISEQQWWCDVVRLLDMPVIMVVGMTLGCINHAMLTERAILADNCMLAGWIANRIDSSMSCYQQNLQTLKSNLTSPFLGEV